MQQSIVKFIALSYRYCLTCFGHYNAHHQEPIKLPLLPLVSVWMWRWKWSQSWSVTNKPTTAENTSTSTFIRKPEAARAVWRAPDDGHCNARNMLSGSFIDTNLIHNFYINYIKLSSSTYFERHLLIFRRSMILIVHVCSLWYSHSLQVVVLCTC